MLVRCADFGIPNGAILLPGTAGKSTRRATGLMYPYVAPRTAKIHTPITLEYRRNGKHRVFPLQRRRPCGSIPIARSTFRCLACPCVVLGLTRAHCLVPTVSMRFQPIFWLPNVRSRLIDSIERHLGLARSPLRLADGKGPIKHASVRWRAEGPAGIDVLRRATVTSCTSCPAIGAPA
jgi:hypothetical protein